MGLRLLYLGADEDDETGTEGRSGGQIINDNFTELYSYSPDAALQSDGSVDGTDQLFTGHVGIGATATVDANALLNLKETLQDAGAAKNALDFGVEFAGSPFIGSTITSFKGLASYTATPTIATGGVTGMLFTAQHLSTSAISNLIGAAFTTGYSNVAGAITNVIGVDVRSASPVASAGGVTDARGVKIHNHGNSGVALVTGLLVDKQAGATPANSYGIRLNGDDLGADIAFGAAQDVRQHFNGAELEFQGAGIAHVATPVVNNGYVTIAINGVAHKFMTGV